MTQDDRRFVTDALDHLVALELHLELGAFATPVVRDAVSFRLAAAIDSLSKTSTEFRAKQFGETWPLMWAVRNRITHAYTQIDAELIENTVHDHVPTLKRQLLDACRNAED